MTQVQPVDGLVVSSSVNDETRNKSPRNTAAFFRKYFLDGQKLETPIVAVVESSFTTDQQKLFVDRHRKLLAFLLPFIFFQLCWWSLAFRYNLLALFPTHYEMSITMIFGAFVAGATSEGGGSIAFPVMTMPSIVDLSRIEFCSLLLKLSPVVARDFSLMIQSTGMASSSFCILFMRLRLEWHSIVYSSLGAAISVIIGLQYLDELFTAAQKKMAFVSIWAAFALALFMLNRQRKRVVYDTIPQFCAWKAMVLIASGAVGGLLTAMTGSGVDISGFSILTLLFRVSEKVATPTSVIVMLLNTWVGFYWRQLMMNAIEPLAWNYFAVSVPVVVVCSPLGAFVSSHLHRQVLASFVYVLEVLAVIGFLITRPPLELVAVGVFISIVGFGLFYLIRRVGDVLMSRVEAADATKTSRPLSSVSSANVVVLHPI